MSDLEARVAALEDELRWWRRLHVLHAIENGRYADIDPSLDVQELRHEVERGTWQRTKEIGAELRSERREATQMVQWLGNNLEEIMTLVDGGRTVTQQGTVLTLVRGNAVPPEIVLERGDWIERDPYTGKIQPSLGPEGYAEYDASIEAYMRSVAP